MRDRGRIQTVEAMSECQGKQRGLNVQIEGMKLETRGRQKRIIMDVYTCVREVEGKERRTHM